MKKSIALLIALMFAAYPVAVHAEGVALSDEDLDQIAAGDWVLLSEGQTSEDVWYNNNDISIEDNAQTEIQAVSNINGVDSAIAVQNNIASVTGDPTVNQAITGSNEAHVTNYNPSEDKSHSSSSFGHRSSEFSLAWSASAEGSASKSFEKSHASAYGETLTIDETLNIAFAAATSSEADCSKGCESESASAAALVVDYDYDLDYLKVEGEASSFSKTETATASASASKTIAYKEKSGEFSETKCSSRKNLSENNHIVMEDTAQTLIQAVTNLNAVGSGVAVQNNIASNVGVSGLISGINVASAVNGI